MRKRTKAREYALQLLYQMDVTHAESAPAIQEFWAHHPASGDVKQFATRLVQGAIEHRDDIDRLIASYASNWDIARMAVVDRNILRLGAYELLYLEEVPPKVCLNEAVELAKRFGDEESSKFVNGILDAIHKAHVHRAVPDHQTTTSPPPACGL
jgi:N utilization substance protein B